MSVKYNPDSLKLRKCAFYQAIILYVAFMPLYVMTYVWVLSYDDDEIDTLVGSLALVGAIFFVILLLLAFGLTMIILAPFSIIALNLGRKEL